MKKPKSYKHPPTQQEIEVYLAYPYKVGRQKALDAIQKQVSMGYGIELLLDAAQAFSKAWEGATDEEFQYCPYPATWFNQQRFLDDRRAWGPKRDLHAAIRGLRNQIMAIEDAIYSHPCNRESPSYWKINGMNQPNEQTMNSYQDLMRKKLELEQKLQSIV